ncbi:MAG: zinc ABC transporter substrate-binding protein [Clostridia bacterium]|nr:zinc ABC transporter substrate-binding protein [Clostridia bacterium]
MKNVKGILLCFLFALSVVTFISCENNSTYENDDVTIICTAYPQYDWIRQIIGDCNNDINLVLLLKGGNDIHSYQPSAEDIMRISQCSMVVALGTESEKWIYDTVENNPSNNTIVVSLIEELGDNAIHSNSEHYHNGQETIHHTEDVDEHVWISYKNAGVLCEVVCKYIIGLDNENREEYTNNLNVYLEKLQKADEEFKNKIEQTKSDTLIFADRFPFRYFIEDYGLNYLAAFEGCSADCEVSFETLISLSECVDLTGANAVFTVDNSDGKIANTVIENTKSKNAQILNLNSMQYFSNEMYDTSFLSVMAENSEKIIKALN